MDHLLGRAVRIAAAALLLVASACGDAVVAGPDSAGVVVEAVEPLPLEDGLALLGPADREIIEAFAANVPSPIPELAVAYAAFVVGDNDPEAPLGDAAKGDLVLANVSDRSYDFRVLCLEEFRQVPCGDTADAWRLSGEGHQLAVVAIGDAGAGRRYVVVSVAGDTKRPMVASRAFTVAGSSEAGSAPAREAIDPPFGGCGFATLVTDLGRRDSFRPPATVAPGDDLFVLVQPCEDDPVAVAVAGIRDGVAVLDTDSTAWNAPVTVTRAAALRVPAEWLAPGAEFQAAVLRLDEREAWMTHAVVVE